jgi:lysophospholipase L1-like esterase
MTQLPELETFVSHTTGEGQPVRIRTNSFGLRGDEITIPKPPNRFRILCLGDETTLGPNVAEYDAWPGQLRTHLQSQSTTEIEVLNGGLPGGCPLTAFILLKQRLAALQPDLVLLHVDVSDPTEDRSMRSCVRLDDEGIPVAVIHPSYQMKTSPTKRLCSEIRLLDWMRGTTNTRLGLCHDPKSQGDHFPQDIAAWATMMEGDSLISAGSPLSPVPRMKLLASQLGADFVVCTCPNAWQLAGLLNGDQKFSRDTLLAPSTALKAMSEETGVPVIDATEQFLAHSNPRELYIVDGQGLSSRGHALYAGMIAQRLLEAPAE